MKKRTAPTRSVIDGKIKIDPLTSQDIRAKILSGELYVDVFGKFLPGIDECDILRAMRSITKVDAFEELLVKYVLPQRLALAISKHVSYVATAEQAIDCACVLIDALSDVRGRHL